MSDELRALLADEPLDQDWEYSGAQMARNAFRAEIRPYVEALEKDNEALRAALRRIAVKAGVQSRSQFVEIFDIANKALEASHAIGLVEALEIQNQNARDTIKASGGSTRGHGMSWILKPLCWFGFHWYRMIPLYVDYQGEQMYGVRCRCGERYP